jgi:hypothetical protein
VQRALCDISGMALLSHILRIPDLDYPPPACGWACSMKKSRSQELSEKATAERRRCRDWLLPFMQNGEPKFSTKEELRVAAMRRSMSRKAHSTSRGSMLLRQPALTIGTNPCADGCTPKPGHFPFRVLPTASGNALWVSAVPSNVAYWGQSGKDALDLRFTAFDPKRTSGA